MTTSLLLAIGLLAAASLIAMLLWSIAFPAKRLWPPVVSTRANRIGVWVLSLLVFASALALAVVDWNQWDWPGSLRWGIGLPMILIGNLVAWRGAARFGMKATSGAPGALVTDGIYRYSRNPQYLADIGIFIGAAILAASPLVALVAAGGIAVLMIAPPAEEPWLEAIHGDAWLAYRHRTRRYL